MPVTPPVARTFTQDDATVVVETRPAFLDALGRADDGDVVYVADGATVDLTAETAIGVPDGVTVASGRDPEAGRQGAAITVSDEEGYLFKVYGEDVTFAGLRLLGPRRGYFDPRGAYDDHDRTGVYALGDGFEMVNCEASGWPHAAVAAGSRTRATTTEVRDSYLHHNAMQGYGYGATFYNGHHLLERNVFDHNRHAVAGFGYDTCGFEVRENYFGSETVGHVVDMHALNQNLDDADPVAGGRIDVHHNTFATAESIHRSPVSAVAIKGFRPRVGPSGATISPIRPRRRDRARRRTPSARSRSTPGRTSG
ncbi:hypothetical protein ACFQH6_04830 [Halobacteriaceae archaeon GCM10025711]